MILRSWSLYLLLAAGPMALPAVPPADHQIEAAIQASYTFHTILQDGLSATVQDGLVTLTGTVPDDEDKALAGDTVVSIRGVVGVDNRIRVAVRPADGIDARIARRLLRRLQAQAGVNARGTSIAVADGIVTLSGTTADANESLRTESLAHGIEQVRAVRNELVVASGSPPARPPDEPMDDASLTAQVNSALRTDALTVGLHVQAIIHDGTVTLIGGPGTSPQKAYAGRLIEDLRGVKSVLNRIVPF